MTTTWMTTTIARENDTSTAMTPEDSSSWRPLAIALPVCLVGIPLVTVIVIVLITCYRSKFKHKENSIFGRKLTGVNSGQSEAADIENEAGGNRTENHASVYANLSETVEEARSKEAMGNNKSSNNSTSSNSSSSGRNGFAKGIHWPPTVLWKKRQVSITENAEAEKNTTTANGTNHKDKRKEKAEREEEEARTTDIEAKISGTGRDRTLGETTAETPTAGNLMKVNGLVVGLHGVPMRQKKETTTMQNQNTDNAATTTTMTVSAKPSQTDNRKTFVVMYPMDSDETTNHLPLAVNDVIFFMDEEKDGWMKGEKKESGEVGWFPRTYVREGMSPLVKRHSMHVTTDASSETNDKTTTTTTTTTTTSARATMATMMMTTTQQGDNDNDNDAFEDFDDDDDDDETEYQALYPYRATEDGDINFDAGDVIVVVEKQDNGWWYGYHGDDHGFFPGSYVQMSRTDELSQTLSHPSSQATGDSGTAAGDAAGHLDDDPEMLLTLAEEDENEVEDDDTLDQQKQNTKKKLSSARKSLGVFLMSLPHKIASASNRPAGNNDVTGQVGSPVVTSDPTTTETLKTKKSDRIVIPTAVKKKTNHKMKIKKTKNDRNLGPMARRSSLAPSPPQSGPQGAVAGALAKGVMSGLAQMVAAEAAKLRHDDDDQMNTTYEEIGTTGLFSPTTRTTEFNLSDSNEIPIYEIVETLNSRGVVSDGRTSPASATAAAASHVFDAKRNDVGSTLQATNHETYSNIDHAVQSIAWPKESSNRKGQETKRTEDNKLHREDKNKEQFEVKNKEQFEVKNKEQFEVKNKEQLEAKHKEQLKLALMSTAGKNHNSSSRKPVPPLKPSYIGSSTPNIAELLKAIENRTDGRVGKSPGNKPRTLAKPGRNNPRGGRGSDLGLTGTDLRMVLPPSLQKPKPLTEKPRYLSPGFPHGGVEASKPDQQLQRRDIYRSLDSIMVAAEAESDEDEDEAAGELEIMKWLRRKQSVEEEELTGRGLEVVGRGDGGGSKLTGDGKESQQMQMGKTKDISDGSKQNVEQVDGARIALMFESLSKAGLNEESFV